MLILDEPTSALDATETQRLFEVVRGLRDAGVGVILVSHFLEDVFAIADTITVLRDAKTVISAAPRDSLTTRAAIDAMLGERPAAAAAPAARVKPAPASRLASLQVKQVSVKGVLDSVSLEVAPGEILAVAGLEGSGASSLLNAIYGQLRIDSGEILLPGGRRAPRGIAGAVRAGVAFVPSDRGRAGLFADQSVRDNIGAVRALALSVDRLMLRVRGPQRASQRSGHPAPDSTGWHRPARACPVRRQPAEGGVRQVARGATDGLPARRPDPRG